MKVFVNGVEFDSDFETGTITIKADFNDGDVIEIPKEVTDHITKGVEIKENTLIKWFWGFVSWWVKLPK